LSTEIGDLGKGELRKFLASAILMACLLNGLVALRLPFRRAAGEGREDFKAKGKTGKVSNTGFVRCGNIKSKGAGKCSIQLRQKQEYGEGVFSSTPKTFSCALR
jgi:hypothetical protein